MEAKDLFDVHKDKFGVIPEGVEGLSHSEVSKSSFKNCKVSGGTAVFFHSTCQMTFEESLLATKTRGQTRPLKV